MICFHFKNLFYAKLSSSGTKIKEKQFHVMSALIWIPLKSSGLYQVPPAILFYFLLFILLFIIILKFYLFILFSFLFVTPAKQTQEKLGSVEEIKKKKRNKNQTKKRKVCKCKVPNESDRREITMKELFGFSRGDIWIFQWYLKFSGICVYIWLQKRLGTDTTLIFGEIFGFSIDIWYFLDISWL